MNLTVPVLLKMAKPLNKTVRSWTLTAEDEMPCSQPSAAFLYADAAVGRLLGLLGLSGGG